MFAKFVGRLSSTKLKMGNQGSSPHEPLDRAQVPQNGDFKMVRHYLIMVHCLFIIQHVDSEWATDQRQRLLF